ncbi:MAG: hypothetical protein P8N76_09455 [Pirellulaceae bacterium]|nr:hypothetical protein [Pirellulaceae bacterium]
MARVPRRMAIDEDIVGVYHCVNRCVRRAFLCGQDAVTGKSYNHRRQWIEDRISFLASVFLVDVHGFGIMSNHYHLVLWNRPDLARELSDRDVVLRWWRLTNYRPNASDTFKKQLIQVCLANREGILELRSRRSSISWMMRYLNQAVAVAANKEDDVSGRFWQGRFDSYRIRDLRQLLSTMIYVDLNPIRAGLAKSLERSYHTSVFRRIAALKRRDKSSHLHQARKEKAVQAILDEWITPIEIKAYTSSQSSKRQRLSYPEWRASDDGCLPMSVENYLLMLDWTGRQLRSGKRGRIPTGLPDILNQLKIRKSKDWFDIFHGCANTIIRKQGKPVNQATELDYYFKNPAC